MGRMIKRLSLFSKILLLSLIVSLAYFSRILFIEKQAKIELSKYQAVKTCQTDSLCRQMFQAKVIKSETQRFVTALGSRYGTVGRGHVQTAICHIQLQLSNSELHDVIVPTNFDLSKFTFDVPNVVVPALTSEYEDVAQNNFPEGSVVYVEMWNNKITFIYSQFIDQNTQPFEEKPSLPELVPDTIIIDNLLANGQQPTPTTQHPLLYYNLAKADAQGAFRFSIILTVLFLVFAYMDTR